jgi:predicted lipoprotein with Yx(FWY)xxD motif
MKLKTLLLGAAVAGLLSTSYALADDYLGGLVKSVEIGGKEVLTGKNTVANLDGMTLYTWEGDVQGTATTPAEAKCYDKCAVAWPVLWAPGDTAVSGDWSLIDRTDAKDGMKQVVYKGWPLYFWFKDKAAGDTTGDGVNNWHTATE